jgi:FkbM family methyltransferase
MLRVPTGEAADAHYDPDNLKRLHSARNAKAGPNVLSMRDGIEFVIETFGGRPTVHEGFCVDPHMALEMDYFLDAAQNKRRLLDIGGLVGTFSLAFTSRPNTEAMVIEPSPHGLTGLRRNCLLNSDRNIRIVDVAAGGHEGTISMKTDWMHLMAVNPATTSTDPVTQISVRTVDSLLFDHRYCPDIVKIDVEGYEKRVLDGMAQLLAMVRPDLHIEIHPGFLLDLGDRTRDVFEILHRADYKLLQIANQPHIIDVPTLRDVDLDYYDQTGVMHFHCVHISSDWARRIRG